MDLGGFAPAVPGLTKTEGLAPGTPPNPMALLAMLLGQRPTAPDTTTEKMAQVIQLLRELGKEDPKIAGLTGEALRLLISGPPAAARPPMPVPSGGPGGGMGVPLVGSPGMPV